MDMVAASSLDPFRIEAAREEDVLTLLGLVGQLAEYEKLSHAVSATAADLHAALFCERPVVEAVIARRHDTAVGFALYFSTFSTFLGKPGLWLEDIFVVPAERGKGYGKALFGHVGRLARERGCGRFEWSVLDWNSPSIEFYRSFGAAPLDDWTIFRLTGEALRRFPDDRN
jgi:GNAT superfamily N-acetyltransferase